MKIKYRALRTIAVILKVLAWIALIGGILAGVAIVLGTFFMPALFGNLGDLPTSGVLTSGLGAIVSALGLVLGTVVYFLLLYASAEMIEVGLAIEQNTRETAYYLRNEGSVAPPPMMR